MKHHPEARPKCYRCGWTDHQPVIDDGKVREYATNSDLNDGRPICTACAAAIAPKRAMTAGGGEQ